MHNPDVLEKAGKEVVLLGNEAIARGALEGGLGFAACYPGTPSSEVSMTLESIAKKAGIYFEWGANEKVAFEAAAGAAYCGVRSMTAMKHFGMNVASDSIYPVVYTGVRGGMVIMVADDPQGLSSAQSEQDTRYMAKMGQIPTLEPSNTQECKDFTKLAFQISEKYQVPVMIRTTTRVSHGIGTVKLGRIPKPKTKGSFKKDFDRYYNIQPELQKLHRRILDKLVMIENQYGSKLNTVEGKGKIGVITSGVSYEHFKELGIKDVRLAKVSLTNPLSKKFISDFINGRKEVIVIEELEPRIEDFVRQVAKEANCKLKIYGKNIFPRWGEFSPDLVYDRVAPVLKLPKKRFAAQERHLKDIKLPARKAVFCPGCPHRSTFTAVKKVLGENTVWGGDIGCYVLGIMEPFEMQDFVISMGAGAGISHGINKVSKQNIVAFMGDSTFFHAGMPAIANLKHNGSNILVMILDNSITAMTGHQPHPGSGRTAMAPQPNPIKIEDVVSSMGIKNVKVVNAYDQKGLQAAVREYKRKKELTVIISRGECRLLMRRELRKKGKEFVTFQIDPKQAKKLRSTLAEFSCPAIIIEKDHIYINPDTCWGCSVCSQICPVGAIKPQVKEKKK